MKSPWKRSPAVAAVLALLWAGGCATETELNPQPLPPETGQEPPVQPGESQDDRGAPSSGGSAPDADGGTTGDADAGDTPDGGDGG